MSLKPRIFSRFFYVTLAFAAACALYAAAGPATREASAQAAPKFNGRIAFASNRNGIYADIYVMNPNGVDQRNLTNSATSEFCPAYSPDGTRIAFTSRRDGRFGEIYTMKPDGTGLSNLTNADFFDQDPSWQRLSTPVVFPPPTPTPTPLPTPTPEPSSSNETWEPYLPTPAQTELDVLSCGGRTFVKVKLTFNTGGYRVTDWGQPARSGSDFEADAKVERWTGGTIQVITFAETVYDLGELPPGSYRFTLTSHGAGVKSREFTVGASGGASPADDAAVYVWQHYRDFLGRDPDQQGFRFWTQNMSSGCGSDAACLERKRVDTSAAFFLSIEFQRTGFFVHKLYRASYGRMARRAEFLPDTRQIARGVVVNTQGWEGLIEENTRAFVEEWVTRPEFKFEYDQLSNTQYVERLYKNAGLSPEPNAGSSLISALSEGQMTRAQILRAVVEESGFSRQEFAPAFVLMQYFGYLQRNPNEGRDTNWDGYNYWLAKLNEFGGDHVRAEMVKAFINSDEYRARFCGQ